MVCASLPRRPRTAAVTRVIASRRPQLGRAAAPSGLLAVQADSQTSASCAPSTAKMDFVAKSRLRRAMREFIAHYRQSALLLFSCAAISARHFLSLVLFIQPSRGCVAESTRER